MKQLDRFPPQGVPLQYVFQLICTPACLTERHGIAFTADRDDLDDFVYALVESDLGAPFVFEKYAHGAPGVTIGTTSETAQEVDVVLAFLAELDPRGELVDWVGPALAGRVVPSRQVYGTWRSIRDLRGAERDAQLRPLLERVVRDHRGDLRASSELRTFIVALLDDAQLQVPIAQALRPIRDVLGEELLGLMETSRNESTRAMAALLAFEKHPARTREQLALHLQVDGPYAFETFDSLLSLDAEEAHAFVARCLEEVRQPHLRVPRRVGRAIAVLEAAARRSPARYPDFRRQHRDLLKLEQRLLTADQ